MITIMLKQRLTVRGVRCGRGVPSTVKLTHPYKLYAICFVQLPHITSIWNLLKFDVQQHHPHPHTRPPPPPPAPPRLVLPSYTWWHIFGFITVTKITILSVLLSICPHHAFCVHSPSSRPNESHSDNNNNKIKINQKPHLQIRVRETGFAPVGHAHSCLVLNFSCGYLPLPLWRLKTY